VCRAGNRKGNSRHRQGGLFKTTRSIRSLIVAIWGDAMDGTEFGRVELATSSIFGLKRRLPYNFKCRCGRTIRISQPVRFRFVCLCGLNHTLRDSEFD
jgi:hypothetical protein